MKKRETEDFVRDILDSANAIEEFIKGNTFEDFIMNKAISTDFPRTSAQSVFHRNPSAFIPPKPCGFSTPRTRMPCGAYMDKSMTPGVHPRLIFDKGEALAG